MANASQHFKHAIYHVQQIRDALKSHRELFKFIGKKSVNVLDVGCGSGKVISEVLFPYLPKQFSKLVGVDKHQSMINHCRSVQVDHRISFQQLDITTKKLPRELIEEFDFITSFYCLHYARDINLAFRNINQMMKPNGELFFIQPFKINPVYDTYRELSKINIWKPYVKDFEGYVAHYSGDNPEAELSEVLQKNGLKSLRQSIEYIQKDYKPKDFIETLKSLDTIKDAIPENLREKYNRDFHACFSKVMNQDFVSEEGLNNISTTKYYEATVYAEKL